MAIGVVIDFETTYELESFSEDFRIGTFESPLADGNSVLSAIEISKDAHELLPNVYNLAFGPLNSKGQIDDKAELTHTDYSRVFSTILFAALGYLKANPGRYVGIDGSENSRAWYYWRFLQRNHEYLSEYFDMFGLKYYVRISRFGKYQYENPFDFGDIETEFKKIPKTSDWPKQMFNYFAFKLKS